MHESLQAFRERLGVFFTGEVYALGDDGEHVLVFTYSGGERDREVGLQILDPGSPGPFWTGLIHTETDASFALLDVTDVSGDGEMDIVFCRSDDAGARLEVAVREGESWRWTTGDPASGCAY